MDKPIFKSIVKYSALALVLLASSCRPPQPGEQGSFSPGLSPQFESGDDQNVVVIYGQPDYSGDRDSRPDYIKDKDNPDFGKGYLFEDLGNWFLDLFSGGETTSVDLEGIGRDNFGNELPDDLQVEDELTPYDIERMNGMSDDPLIDELEQQNRDLTDRLNENRRRIDLQNKELDKSRSEKREILKQQLVQAKLDSASKRLEQLKKDVNRAIERHNQSVTRLQNQTPKVSENPNYSNDGYLTPHDSRYGRKVRAGRAYVDSIDGLVDRMPKDSISYKVGKQATSLSYSALEQSDMAYANGDATKGDALHNFAMNAADLGLSALPGVSWGKDIYEAWTGENLVTGEQLSEFERAMAVVGAVTIGVGSKAGLVVDVFSKAAPDAFKVAKNILDSADKWGDVGADGVKKFTGLAEKPFFRDSGKLPLPYKGPSLQKPDNLRFTQDSIGNKFSDGTPLRDVIDGLKSGSIDPDGFPPVRVFKSGDDVFTLDNRRLKVFQEAGLNIKTAPATLDEVAKEAYKLKTKNGGTSIKVRGGGL